MCFRIRIASTLALLLFAVALAGRGQSQMSPLTNNDVIKMTKSGLAESSILAVIQANPSDFDASPNALMAMKNAGVTQDVIKTVMAAAASKSSPTTTIVAPGSRSGPPSGQVASQNATPASNSSSPPPMVAVPSAPKEPMVLQLADTHPGIAASQRASPVPIERNQLVQTRTKASSLGGLAGNSVTAQALQAGSNTASTEVLLHSGGSTGGVVASQAGSIFNSMVMNRKPTVTYIWAVAGPASTTQANSDRPSFSLNFAGWMNVNVDDFEPCIVKLTPTPAPNVWRLVGASRGKDDATSSSAVDWQVYSNFLEDRVPIRLEKTSPGVFEISVTATLEGGEYGIALRPVSKNLKFSGADIARNQGNGKVFNSVWTFEVK
jgi:hypothetical protein